MTSYRYGSEQVERMIRGDPPVKPAPVELVTAAEDTYIRAMTDLEKWTAFLREQGIRFEVEEWDLRTKKQHVIRIDDERAHGFSGYGVGVAFSLDGAFLEMGGWA